MDEEQIIKQFYGLRETLYVKRKEYLLAKLRKEWVTIENKVRFILAIIEEKLKVNRVKKRVIVNNLKAMNFATATEINQILPEKKKLTVKQEDENGEEEEGGQPRIEDENLAPGEVKINVSSLFRKG